VAGGPGEVVGGGCEGAAFAPGRTFAHGMDGILDNTLGFDHEPSPAELAKREPSFGLRPLLDLDANVPMLVISGAEVHLLPDTGHCAVADA